MSEHVPEGWVTDKLEKHIDILSGFPFKSALFTDDTSKIGLIRIRDLVNQVLGTFYNGDYSEEYLIRKGDVLVGMDGDFTAVKWKARNALLNQRILKVSAKENGCFDTDYIFHMLIPELLKINNETGATTVKHLSVKDVRNIERLFPPLPEQQNISSILTSVDEVIEKTESQIRKLQDLKKGVMQELLTKGIGHTEFKDSPVGKIPKEWEVVCLLDVLDSLVDCEHKTAPYVDSSEYLVVRTSNVRNGQLIYEDIKYTTREGYKEWTKRSVPKHGDILFTREAPAGESCLVPKEGKVCLGQRMVLLKPNHEAIRSDYLSWFLISDMAIKEIYRLSIGTTVARINIEDIYKINCVLPTLKEQKSIASAIDSVHKNINSKTQLVNSLNSIKKSLMQDLLTGKVRVSVGLSA